MGEVVNEGHRNMPRLDNLKQFCTWLDSCTCQDCIIYALTVLTKPLCNAENLIICLLFTPREKMQRQTLLLSLEANLHNRQKQNLRNYFWASQYARPLIRIEHFQFLAGMQVCNKQKLILYNVDRCAPIITFVKANLNARAIFFGKANNFDWVGLVWRASSWPLHNFY